jgi:predicted deacetylase
MLLTSLTFDDISPYRLSVSKLNNLLDILDSLCISCTLFVIPSDFGIKYSKNSDFVNFLKRALASGHELAQHGHVHINKGLIAEFGNSFFLPYPSYRQQKESIQKGKERLLELTGVKPCGFRAPGYLHNAMTISALSNLDFRYDSSKTVFKPTHLSPTRIRVLRNLKPTWDKGVLEIPITGDYSLHKSSENLQRSLSQAIEDFKLVESRKGTFVVNNHLNYVDANFLFLFLNKLVEKIGNKTEFVRLCDIEGSTKKGSPLCG